LGDLLLQILFHAQIGAEKGTFTIDEVMQRLAEKLVRRHPHVFGSPEEKDRPANAEEVLGRWEEIKRNERQQTGRQGSVLDGVPKTLPALLRAFQVQARASRVGFDWPHSDQGLEQVIAKVEEEVRELREVLTPGLSDSLPRRSSPSTGTTGEETRTRLEDEFGDILFALVNLARFFKVNPEEALRKAINRFTERFSYIETQAASRGQALEDMTLADMESLWEEAKGQG
ncbi:MAG: nucleoside triphosphate pyrophosphohydrolase, partial [Nitrospiraceae bacterium]